LPTLPPTADDWRAKAIADATTVTTDSNRNNNWKIVSYPVVDLASLLPIETGTTNPNVVIPLGGQ
jgi:hypothetical protein